MGLFCFAFHFVRTQQCEYSVAEEAMMAAEAVGGAVDDRYLDRYCWVLYGGAFAWLPGVEARKGGWPGCAVSVKGSETSSNMRMSL